MQVGELANVVPQSFDIYFIMIFEFNPMKNKKNKNKYNNKIMIIINKRIIIIIK